MILYIVYFILLINNYQYKIVTKKEVLKTFLKFRQQLGLSFSKGVVKKFWGEEGVRLLSGLDNHRSSQKIKFLNISKIEKEKIAYFLERKEYFIFLDILKFIGISGSIAAGNVDKDDDIDLFIVVKDHTLWLYRFILFIRLRRNRHIRTVSSIDVKNKFCINYIVE